MKWGECKLWKVWIQHAVTPSGHVRSSPNAAAVWSARTLLGAMQASHQVMQAHIRDAPGKHAPQQHLPALRRVTQDLGGVQRPPAVVHAPRGCVGVHVVFLGRQTGRQPHAHPAGHEQRASKGQGCVQVARCKG